MPLTIDLFSVTVPTRFDMPGVLDGPREWEEVDMKVVFDSKNDNVLWDEDNGDSEEDEE